MDDQSDSFPAAYRGVHYTEALRQLALKRGVIRYFEIGVQAGRNFSRIPCQVAIGVDPSFQLTQNVAHHKKQTMLFQLTSDRYFCDIDTHAVAGGAIDFAFLDGMHLFEYLLRDFYNTERVCSTQSLIAIHDCMPLNAIMTERNEQKAVQDSKGSSFESYWTGDVWKIVPILQKFRPDLRVLLVDCPPTGLVLVSNLDPTSTFLKDNYLSIVTEFADVPNTADSISMLYAQNKIMAGSDILNEFDQSLYLRT